MTELPGVHARPTITVLLCGGPANGHMMQIPSREMRNEILVPRLTNDVGMWQAVETSPDEPVAFETIRYVHHRVDPSTGLVVFVLEDDTRQPPRLSTLHNGYRTCHKCDVRWHGGPECWCCGADVTNQTPPRRRRGLAR